MKFEFKTSFKTADKVWAAFAEAQILPEMKAEATGFDRNGKATNVEVVVTVRFAEDEWSTVRDLIDNLMEPEESIGSTRVRNVMAKNVKMGDMMEVDGVVGEVVQHVRQEAGLVWIKIAGITGWVYDQNARVRVHPS